MSLEKLSANSLDSKNVAGSSEKREAIEHLRETRNILTPFIGDYVAEIRDRNASEHAIDALNTAVGFKPQVAPNYTSLLEKMEEEGISIVALEDFGSQSDFEKALDHYKSRLQEFGVDDTDAHEVFQEQYNLIKKILDDEGFDSKDLTAPFFKVLDYAQRNAGHLTDPDAESPIGELSRGVTNEIVLGYPLTLNKEGRVTESFPPVFVLPVGEYGVPTTLKIYNTIQLMLADTHVLEEKATALVEAHKEIFAKTARGQQDLRQMENMSRAAIKTLHEGIITLGQAMAQLSMQKIDGYENDPDRLIEDLVKNELPNQLGYLAPPAYIAPLSLVGQCLIDLVQKDSDGKLILNPEIITTMLDVKDRMINRDIIDSTTTLPSIGRGCPVSFKGQGIRTSGINELSQLFLELYKRDPVGSN